VSKSTGQQEKKLLTFPSQLWSSMFRASSAPTYHPMQPCTCKATGKYYMHGGCLFEAVKRACRLRRVEMRGARPEVTRELKCYRCRRRSTAAQQGQELTAQRLGRPLFLSQCDAPKVCSIAFAVASCGSGSFQVVEISQHTHLSSAM
jgi:hypothetical protein